MQGVVEGLAVIAVVIAVGFALVGIGVVDRSAHVTLSRLVFFVATPCLLFQTLADADLHAVFSSVLAVTAVSTAVVATACVVITRWVWRRPVPVVTIATLASSYVNAGNLGIPIAGYVLGDASYMAPVMLFQLMVMAPIAFTVLDTATSTARPSFRRVVSQPLRNPVTVGCGLGVAFAVSGLEIPEFVSAPVELMAGVAIPGMLLAYGMSLHGSPLPGRAGGRDLVLVAGLKVVVQPVVAYLLGRFAFGLDGVSLLAVTITGALPSAQNIFVNAVRYGSGVTLARDAILATTVLCSPVLILTAAALS